MYIVHNDSVQYTVHNGSLLYVRGWSDAHHRFARLLIGDFQRRLLNLCLALPGPGCLRHSRGVWVCVRERQERPAADSRVVGRVSVGGDARLPWPLYSDMEFVTDA